MQRQSNTGSGNSGPEQMAPSRQDLDNPRANALPPGEGRERTAGQARHSGTTTVLDVEGMNCSNCVRHVQETLCAVANVLRAEVDLEQKMARVRWGPAAEASPTALIGAVEKAGFSARVREEGKPAPESPRWPVNIILGGTVTAALMVMEWVFGLGLARWYHWLAFGLATPVQFISGAPFYRGAWSQLKRGRSNMDTLVALGSSTAYFFSVWSLLSSQHGHLFFMESTAIITLISVGHLLEARVAARAAASLRALLNLTPAQARRLDGHGQEELAPVSLLTPGDRIVLKPGDRAPVDGEVVNGEAAMNESMLTGESMPVDKKPGEKIYAGSLNQSGRLEVKVTATGQSTALAHIIELVQRAQTSQARIQKLGDRVSSVFVPVVVALAILTAAWWLIDPASGARLGAWLEPYLWKAHHPESPLAAAVYHAAAVLIIACPCAMGLATPIAIMAGANVAAERGILIRDAPALEKSGLITDILFDKTGTLTQGKVTVLEVKDCADLDSRVSQARRTLAASPHPDPLPEGEGREKEVIASRCAEARRESGVDEKRIQSDGNQGKEEGRERHNSREDAKTRREGEPGVDEKGTHSERNEGDEETRELSHSRGGAEARRESALGVIPDNCALGAALARGSTHPLSQAVAALSNAELRFEQWREIRGKGIEGVLGSEHGGGTIRLGSLSWLAEFGISEPAVSPHLGGPRPFPFPLPLGEGQGEGQPSPATSDAVVNSAREQGATVIGLARDQELLTLFILKDQLKPGAAEMVKELQDQGKELWLITGDHPATAKSIAKAAGLPLDHIFAEVQPGDKAALVRKLQSQNKRVAFIGDGINDAPALEQADLGIAVSRASDVAREAADIVLLNTDIQSIPEALRLAAATLRTIKQNLFWAFFYNAAAIPLAMFGFLSPVVSALAMGLSDLLVIGNALRLRYRFKPGRR